MQRRLPLLLIIACTIAMYSCTHPSKPTANPNDGGYPPAVANIIINKCAIAGCHNAASYQNADGLLMDTWDHLFNGGNNGAVAVAYSPKFSSLLYFVNTDSLLGPVAVPTMPQSTTTKPQAPLSKTEYQVLYNWIASGAPDKNGNIPFAADPDTRQKIYLTNQGCDLLAVIDAQKRVV